MERRVFFIILILSMAVYFPMNSYAGTNITITDIASFDNVAQAEADYEAFIDSFFTENEEVIPSGLAMVNTLGYPNGKSTIKPFPHFEFGVAAGVGILEYGRYEDFSEEYPTIPFGGINAAVHVGTGVTERLDVTVKFFSLGMVYKVDESFDDEAGDVSYKVRIKDTDVYSVGAKFRYNLLPNMTIVPLLLSFGGVSVNLAFDYMKADTKIIMEMSDTENVDVLSTPISATATYNNEGRMEWNLYSVTPEMLVYLDLLYFISIYTGPSVSFNYGTFDFTMRGNGNIITNDPVGPYTPGDVIGTTAVDIDYSMKPYAMIPKWTLGLELNLSVLKLQAEVTSILNSPNDSVMGQVGIRMQF
jgi:hypothetical protein